MKFYYSMDDVSRKIYAYPRFNQETQKHRISGVTKFVGSNRAWHSSRNSKKLNIKELYTVLLLLVLRI